MMIFTYKHYLNDVGWYRVKCWCLTCNQGLLHSFSLLKYYMQTTLIYFIEAATASQEHMFPSNMQRVLEPHMYVSQDECTFFSGCESVYGLISAWSIPSISSCTHHRSKITGLDFTLQGIRSYGQKCDIWLTLAFCLLPFSCFLSSGKHLTLYDSLGERHFRSCALSAYIIYKSKAHTNWTDVVFLTSLQRVKNLLWLSKI